MIKKIAHLGDIHIPKSPTRHDEYRQVFKNLYKSLANKNIDRIVIVGDLFHDYIELQPEANILAGEFLNNLAKIAPVRITRGNHDIRKKALKRIDSIENVVTLINNPNIKYYNESKFFIDDNVAWAVWKHGEKNNNPWKAKKNLKELNNYDGSITIDLFHDPINGSVSPIGYEFKKKTYYSLKDFQGTFSFFGDIHKKQLFGNKAAYCGSLIAQNFAEGDYEFHGYIVWNIDNFTCHEVPIENDYSFKTVRVNPYTDFEELSIEIENPTKFMRVRVVWQTLPNSYNEENKRNVLKFLKETYNPIQVSNKIEFIEDDEIVAASNVDIENIAEQNVQHEIFKDYFEKIGVNDEQADLIIQLDDEISSRIEKEEFTHIEWNIIKLYAKNFMSYESLEIDWRDMNGLFQITGLNTAGKTTIMKLITYVLYNKTLETENKVKFGDSRYINNRLNVDVCEGSIIVEVNGEYFGIKRSTRIEKTKNGEVKGTPTTLQYFQLESPDDDFVEENSFENLNDEQRIKTQKILDRAIGSYDNFKRVVLTTSDTLNKTLSDDKSMFIDSLLFDSGLDIFDLKLETLKEYVKELSIKNRVNCNVEKSKELIENLEKEIVEINDKVSDFENNKLPDVETRIIKGDEFVETLVKKLNKIDVEIYTLNVGDTNKEIEIHNGNIELFRNKESRINESLSKLKDFYDAEKLNELLDKKDSHKQNEYNKKMEISKIEREILIEENKVQRINGEISVLKKEGVKKKEEITTLKKSKICPTCGQPLTKKHQDHFNELISSCEKEMYGIGEIINNKLKLIPNQEIVISGLKNSVENIKIDISKDSLAMDTVLNEIGVITNDKNDFDKRKELLIELEQIPIKIENQELMKQTLTQKIELYNKSLNQIDENKKIENGINKAKERLDTLKTEKDEIKDTIYRLNNLRGQHLVKIRDTNDNVLAFKEQEKQDEILSIYKKCIHRDGIPTQLLKTYAIPKINRELDDLLQDVGFRVWLDDEELRLKLAYNNRLDAVIDAISASGKERTFASVALKFALNQINSKSKPTIIMLDEVCGKLTENSVEEFNDLLIKMNSKTSKILLIEHNHFFNPDYIINVTKNDNDISELIIE